MIGVSKEVTMQLPDYWMPRPQYALDKATRAQFDQILAEAMGDGANRPIVYKAQAPKWQFLCYLAECGYALHGSQNQAIARFEPHQPKDMTTFGAQLAVYAASDGIWPMYFALLDRRYPTVMMNGCARIEGLDGVVGEPLYQFSIGRHLLPLRPWKSGAVYILPRESFVAQPSIPFGEITIHIAQLASFEPVVPLAWLAVDPEDFPFLEQVRGHDDDRAEVYAAAMQSGAPWPDL
jgi:hypothetical protein